MQKIFLILVLISIIIIAGCQLQKEIPSQPVDETENPTPDSIAKDLQSAEETEDIDNIEVLIDENTF